MFYKKLEKVVADVAGKSILSFIFSATKIHTFPDMARQAVILTNF